MKIGIIGAGASGMTAAIAAAEAGAEVTLIEKNDRIGKKLLATGNGKCNLGNLDFHMDQYYCCDKNKLSRIFSAYSVEDSISFFQKNGLMLRNKNSYLYPYCEQASAVLDRFRYRLLKEKVRILTGTEIREAAYLPKRGRFRIRGEGFSEEFDRLIIACGGPASLKKGEGLSGFALARSFGHHIQKLAPGLVQLRSKDGFMKAMAGVRCQGKARLFANGRLLAEEEGELQFTDYGISGIPIFQFSRMAAYALLEKKRVSVLVDFFPDQEKDAFFKMLWARLKENKDSTLEELMTGTVNKKINAALIKKAGCKPSDQAGGLEFQKLEALFESYRSLEIGIDSTNPMENAQVCAGGVSFEEINTEMESCKQKGLYLTGEVLDVDGKCGGYNLQWAWTSGYIAGKSAAGFGKRKTC